MVLLEQQEQAGKMLAARVPVRAEGRQRNIGMRSWLLVLLCLTMPFGKYQVSLVVVNLSFDNAALFLASLLFFVEVFSGKNIFLKYKAHYVNALVFLGFSLIGALVATSLHTHLRFLVPIAGSLGMLALFTGWVRSIEDVRVVRTALIVTVLVIVLGAAVQSFFGISGFFPEEVGKARLLTVGWDGGRTVGFMSSHGLYSAITALGVFLVINVAHDRSCRGLPWAGPLWGIAVLLAAFSLALSQSRSGMLAFSLGAMTYVVLSYLADPRSIARFLLVLLSALVAGLVLLLFDEIYLMLEAMSPATAQRRFDYAAIGWELVRDNPVAGIGYSAFTEVTGLDHILHNTYLVVGLGSGIPGLIAFVMFPVLALQRAGRAWKMGRFHRDMVVCLVPALVSTLSALFFFSGVNTPAFWIIIGLLVVLPEIPAPGRGAARRR